MSLSAIVGALLRFLREQQLYLAIAVAVYAIFWGIGQEVSVPVVVIYSLCIGNLTRLAIRHVEPLYSEREFPHGWLFFLSFLAALAPVIVVVSTAIVFWTDIRPGGGNFRVPPRWDLFWNYLRTGWKFPLVATLIFGIVARLYLVTKHRLECRNQELQQALALGMAEREFQKKELQRAREIQQALLPKEIPQIAGFDVAASWEPARVVGGDYFDIIKLAENKLAICIADVVGKGVPAALLMASVQATLRAYAFLSESPAWVCSRLNSVLHSNIESDKFVTLFYGVIDGERRTLHYTNAGHLPPILIGASGWVREVADGGAVLGGFPDWKYDESVVPLSPGDRLLLFTDGITEAGQPDGEEFGEQRLLDLARKYLNRPAPELNATVLSTVKQFCESRLHDDVTLIVIGVGEAMSPRPETPDGQRVRVPTLHA